MYCPNPLNSFLEKFLKVALKAPFNTLLLATIIHCLDLDLDYIDYQFTTLLPHFAAYVLKV